MRLPGGDFPARLSDRLHALDYTVEGVRRLLGPVAADALGRDETVPATRRLIADDSSLGAVICLFLLKQPVAEQAVAVALGYSPVELGDLVEVNDGQVSARVELAPYAVDDHDWLVASDWSARRLGRPTAADHVLGVGGASTMLAQCTVRPQISRALDVGTGCGVQAFHLAGHSQEVVGTDISERCLQLASFNSAMNEISLDVRLGNLFEPVEGERFDLIVSNPPFVVGSPNDARHDYRDSALEGDGVCASVVRGASEHLTESGWCQMLANWEITDRDDWAAHPTSWVAASGLDAWVIQRDVQDPAAYIEMWLCDAGEQWSPAYRELYDRWMSTLERRGVLGVGFGLISLRRSEHDSPVQHFQHVPQSWVQPVSTDIERWFAVRRALATDPAGILMQPLRIGSDVMVERHRGATEPEDIAILRRSSGMGWSGPVDPFGLDLLATLDGKRPAADAVLAAAAKHDVEPEDALAAAVPVLGQMAVEGFVL